MDALEQAKGILERDKEIKAASTLPVEHVIAAYIKVQALAAIAQVEATRENTEQLKRIADALYVRYTNGSEESLIKKMTDDVTGW